MKEQKNKMYVWRDLGSVGYGTNSLVILAKDKEEAREIAKEEVKKFKCFLWGTKGLEKEPEEEETSVFTWYEE